MLGMIQHRRDLRQVQMSASSSWRRSFFKYSFPGEIPGRSRLNCWSGGATETAFTTHRPKNRITASPTPTGRLKTMTWAMGHTQQAQQPGGRFILPETPVSKLIDQLTAHCTGQERQSAVAEADPRKPLEQGAATALHRL